MRAPRATPQGRARFDAAVPQVQLGDLALLGGRIVAPSSASANPTEDISNKPVVEHPHNTSRTIPERLPAAKIKELSVLQPAKALACHRGRVGRDCRGDRDLLYFWNPVLYLLAVMVIGSRQHALMILGHDASHYRYLPTRWQNDLFGNIFLMWPTFASVEGFRKFHGTHHQYTNLPGDGNRQIWRTHDANGELEPGWVFPKTRLGWPSCFCAGSILHRYLWIVRGVVGSLPRSLAALDVRRAARFLRGRSPEP